MDSKKGVLGFAMCGSFCTMRRALQALTQLCEAGWQVMPIMSDAVFHTDTRFGSAADFRDQVTSLCGTGIVHTTAGAEPFGPAIHLDALIVAPCSGNTLAKAACGITDTAVTMAIKAQLRSDRPVLLGIASNDGLSANLGNIGTMLNRKNVYFVPFGQDDPEKKPHSLICDFSQIASSLDAALTGRQIQPLLLRQ